MATNMMATTYSPGGSSLSTSGPGYPVPDPQAIKEMEQFAYEMALRRRAAQAAPVAAAAPAYRPAPRAPMLSAAPSGIDAELDYMTKRAKLMQLDAAERPAPTRMVTGPQMIPGPTLDPFSMNAYQKKLYEPENSQGGNLGVETVAQTEAKDDADWQAFLSGGGRRFAPGY